MLSKMPARLPWSSALFAPEDFAGDGLALGAAVLPGCAAPVPSDPESIGSSVPASVAEESPADVPGSASWLGEITPPAMLSSGRDPFTDGQKESERATSATSAMALAPIFLPSAAAFLAATDKIAPADMPVVSTSPISAFLKAARARKISCLVAFSDSPT